MRIALVVTGGFDESGRERVIPSLLWLVERLARRHAVVVYVLRYHHVPRRYNLRGATIRDLGRPQGLLRQIRALAAAMREDGPFDVVHGYWAMPAGLVAAVVGRRLSVPSVVTCDSGEFVSVHAVGYGLQSHWRGRLAVALTARLAGCITVCTTYQHERAAACRVHARIIPIGVDTGHFGHGPGLSDGPPYRLVHVASINPVKDHSTLLRAVRILVERGIDVRVDIVGEDTLSGAVAALARDLGLAGRITLLGFRSSHELPAVYHASHVCVLSSRHEAAGVVLLEAAACGVPVAGTAVGYLADWTPDAATSVTPGNPLALADALDSLLRDPARRKRQAERAAAWTREHDADWTGDAFEGLYYEMTGLSARTPPDAARCETTTPGS